MRVYIPIFSASVAGHSFSVSGQNPGVGGTGFTSIKLALLLAERYPELDVRIINNSEIYLRNPPQNIRVIVLNDLDLFLSGLYGEMRDFVVIMTMALLQYAAPEHLNYLRDVIVAWLHHPFQFNAQITRLRLAAHVHVGAYQYYSNRPFYRANWYIQNPFTSVALSSDYTPLTGAAPLRIIYLGTLIRVKGFGHLARQWSSIKAAVPGVELHVIGSSATYGKKPEHDVVPCDLDFAEEILAAIPVSDIESGQVVFHGNLGEEKVDVIRSGHIAILNPTGASEAFPASPLECMACGLPVIASDDYGMSDSMRFFPELVLKNPEQIASRVSWLLADPNRYTELRERALTVAKWFDSQTGVILAKWRRLIEFVVEGHDEMEIPDVPPIEAVYGSPLLLRHRQFLALASGAKRWLQSMVS